MDNTCAACKFWLPKRSGAMARHRMAICELGKPWRFLPPQASCERFTPAPQDVQTARVKWLGK